MSSSPRAGRRATAAAYAALVAAAIALPAPAAGQADTCPNAEIRERQGTTFLPDCRAYEQVSPVDKNGYDVAVMPADIGGIWPRQAAATVPAIFYEALGAFGDQASSPSIDMPYLSRRTATGWSTNGLMDFPAPRIPFSLPGMIAFTPNLELGMAKLEAYSWLRDNRDGTYRTVTVPPDPNNPLASGITWGQAFTVDLQHFTIVRQDVLRVYEMYSDDSGAFHERLAGVAPDGDPLPTSEVASTMADAMSKSGDRLVMKSPFGGSPPYPDSNNGDDLYLRDTGSEPHRTVWLTEPESDAPADPNPDRRSEFWGASDDFSKLFFTSGEKLTADSTGDPSAHGDSWGDLYVYDVSTADLRDISIDTEGPDGGRVLGVVGTSDDGSVAYFVARGRLGTGKGTAGAPNLFRWVDGPGNGTLSYVATLADFDTWSSGPEAAGDLNVFRPGGNRLTRDARVSSDGRLLVFRSRAEVIDGIGGDAYEIYRYDGSADSMTCISCLAGGDGSTDASFTSKGLTSSALRFVSEDGRRVFFQTTKSMVPRDSNGVQDVYVHDAGTGVIALVSSGQGEEAYFLDADLSGDNVYFGTRGRLVGQDVDSLMDVYVARVGGGLPAQERPPGNSGCVEDHCQGEARPNLPRGRLGSSTIAGRDGTGSAQRSQPVVARLRKARGATATLRVRVPAGGRIEASGRGVRRAVVRARRAGNYRLDVRLGKRARQTLARGKRVSVRLTVRFVSSEGPSSTTRLRLAFVAAGKSAEHGTDR